MGATPDPVGEAGAKPVRDRNRQEKLERDDSEPCCEWAVPRREGNDDLGERERNDRVEGNGADMDGDEHSGEDPEEPMDVLDGEAGKAGNAPLPGEQDAREHAGRDEKVRDDSTRAGGIPGGCRSR